MKKNYTLLLIILFPVMLFSQLRKFNPLPANVILGYTHGWENQDAPFLYYNQVKDSKYNVYAYSFIETRDASGKVDGFTPILTYEPFRYPTKEDLKRDIKTVRDKGIPVIVSIGGQNGHVELNTVAQKDIFVKGLKEIIDFYEFDGVDIDFEGGSMNFGAGALKDFSYASISAFPKLKNCVDAFKELKAYYGKGFILTAAPETQYVQSGRGTFLDRWGSFLPVIENLRDEMDLLMVQLYNSGSQIGLDNNEYKSETPDFLVAMTDMLIKGFNVASTGIQFKGLPPSKVMIAIPAAPRAAGSGYLTPEEGIKAFDYLRFGKKYGGKYVLQSTPDRTLRGVMTWSVNWDASYQSGFEFSKKYSDYFAKTLSIDQNVLNDSRMLVYFKENKLSLEMFSNERSIASVEVFNVAGQSILSYKNVENNKNLLLDSFNFLTRQMFLVVVTDNLGHRQSIKVLN